MYGKDLTDEQNSENVDLLASVNIDSVPQEHKPALLKLLEDNRDLFARTAKDLTVTDVVKMEIETDDCPPISSRLYHVPLNQQKVIDEHITQMLDAGIIKESNSPWASPVVLIKKQDRTTRFCVDYH